MGKQPALAPLVALLVLPACSGATRLGAGPVVSYVSNERPKYGAEVLARAAAGLGEEAGFGGVEAATRLQLTERLERLGFGLGPAWFGTAGRSLVTLDFTPMLGLERFDEKLMAVTTLRGGAGIGFALERGESRRPPLWAHSSPGRYEDVSVETTALTFELVGGVDFPATREAQVSAGFLVGFAWVTQRYTVELPVTPKRPWPWPLAPRRDGGGARRAPGP